MDKSDGVACRQRQEGFLQIARLRHAGAAPLPCCRESVRSSPGGRTASSRHPIDAGFLLNDFSLSNLGLLSLVFGWEFHRILREESLPRTVSSFRDYCGRVQYRFIPGVI